MNKQKAVETIQDLLDSLEKKEIFVEDFDPSTVQRLRRLLENPTPTIIVCMNGGLIDAVYYGDHLAKKLGIKVITCDYDVEGADPETISRDPDGNDAVIENRFVEDPSTWTRKLLASFLAPGVGSVVNLGVDPELLLRTLDSQGN